MGLGVWSRTQGFSWEGFAEGVANPGNSMCEARAVGVSRQEEEGEIKKEGETTEPPAPTLMYSQIITASAFNPPWGIVQGFLSYSRGFWKELHMCHLWQTC